MIADLLTKGTTEEILQKLRPALFGAGLLGVDAPEGARKSKKKPIDG